MKNFGFTTPAGNLTEREQAIDELYMALRPVLPGSFERHTLEQRELSEVVSDFWIEKRGRARPTAKMIKLVTRMIELSLEIASDHKEGMGADALREPENPL
jgi:hypothetical protein